MKQQTVEKWQKILEMQRNYPGTINDFCHSIHSPSKHSTMTAGFLSASGTK